MADITGHTPTPWSIGKRRWITSGDLDIARIHSVSKIGEAEAVANAEFIIRACNSHDDLVDTLQAVRWFFLMGAVKARRDPNDAERKIISQVVDAIAKAKEGVTQ